MRVCHQFDRRAPDPVKGRMACSCLLGDRQGALGADRDLRGIVPQFSHRLGPAAAPGGTP